MKGHLKIQLATLVAGLVFVANATAQEWPRFRGPNGTGISLAKGIPSKFALADADWRVSLKGEGHSSPVLWGDRIFVTGSDSKKGEYHLQCLKATDGSEVWAVSSSQAKHRIHRFNHLVSSTPATDGKRVVVVKFCEIEKQFKTFHYFKKISQHVALDILIKWGAKMTAINVTGRHSK